MNRDILKNLATWSGAKNSNISSRRLRSDAIGRLHRVKKIKGVFNKPISKLRMNNIYVANISIKLKA